VQVSTDYVFGADYWRRKPYTEDDQPAPVNVYGESKLAGEHAAETWEKHFVVRTCGLYSVSPPPLQCGRNFVETMLSLATTRRSLRIVNDQRCTPSYVPHVAAAIIRLLETQRYGTYHVTNLGSATWFEIARELFRLAGIRMAVEPITTKQYAAAAPRPLYSVLDTSKYRALDIAPLPVWQDGLRDYLQSAPVEPERYAQRIAA